LLQPKKKQQFLTTSISRAKENKSINKKLTKTDFAPLCTCALRIYVPAVIFLHLYVGWYSLF